jgi:hypothetical protein
MHCTYLSVSSLHIATDHVEQEREEPPELAPVEDANPSRTKASLGASNPIP